MPQPTGKPVRKVSAGGVTGAVVTIFVFIMNEYVTPDHKITGEVASAITTVLSLLVAYIIPPGANETIVQVAGQAKSALV